MVNESSPHDEPLENEKRVNTWCCCSEVNIRSNTKGSREAKTQGQRRRVEVRRADMNRLVWHEPSVHAHLQVHSPPHTPQKKGWLNKGEQRSREMIFCLFISLFSLLHGCQGPFFLVDCEFNLSPQGQLISPSQDFHFNLPLLALMDTYIAWMETSASV